MKLKTPELTDTSLQLAQATLNLKIKTANQPLRLGSEQPVEVPQLELHSNHLKTPHTKGYTGEML